MPPRKRVAPDGSDAAELKRCKTAVEDACAEFLCPITLALPVDPVTAEDGEVYERAAIEDWFRRNPSVDGKVKSPSSHQMIGKARMLVW